MNNPEVSFYVTPGGAEIRLLKRIEGNVNKHWFVISIFNYDGIYYYYGDRILNNGLIKINSKEDFFNVLQENGIFGPFTIYEANIFDSFKEYFWIWYCNQTDFILSDKLILT